MSDKSWNILSFGLSSIVIVSGLGLVYFNVWQTATVLSKVIIGSFYMVAIFFMVYSIVREKSEGSVKKKIIVTFEVLIIVFVLLFVTRKM